MREVFPARSITGEREERLDSMEPGLSSASSFLRAESIHQALIKHLLCARYKVVPAGILVRQN